MRKLLSLFLAAALAAGSLACVPAAVRAETPGETASPGQTDMPEETQSDPTPEPAEPPSSVPLSQAPAEAPEASAVPSPSATGTPAVSEAPAASEAPAPSEVPEAPAPSPAPSASRTPSPTAAPTAAPAGKAALATPKITAADALSGGGVLLNWTAIGGAAYYRVYRSASRSGGYQIIATGVTAAKYTDTSAKDGEIWFYKVRAVAGDTVSAVSAEVGRWHALGCAIKAAATSEGWQKFAWSARAKADGYLIYRSVNGGSYVRVADVKDRTWTDKSAAFGKTYRYCVQPYRLLKGERIGGNRGSVYTWKPGVTANPAVTVYQDTDTVVISWEAVEGATGYYVSYADSGEKLQRIASVGSGTLTLKHKCPAPAGSIIRYYVRAYAMLGSTRQLAPSSPSVKQMRLKASAESTAVRAAEGALTVTWKGVKGATGYRVFYKNGSGGYRSIETDADARSCTIPAVNGTLSQSYVRAIRAENGGITVGSRTAVRELTPYWYYALLIGNAEYDYLQQLRACKYDADGIARALKGRYAIRTSHDLTASGMRSAIRSAYAGADENCTCLFFYSGHGVSTAGSYSGALVGVDGEIVLPSALRAALDAAVPGRCVVLLDSCASGSYIAEKNGSDTAARTASSPASFNSAVVSAFRNAGPVTVRKSGGEGGTAAKYAELRAPKYTVLTACAADALSYATNLQGYSFFSLEVSRAFGWDYYRGAGCAAADGGDGIVTAGELYNAVKPRVTDSEVQAYMPDSSVIVRP